MTKKELEARVAELEREKVDLEKSQAELLTIVEPLGTGGMILSGPLEVGCAIETVQESLRRIVQSDDYGDMDGESNRIFGFQVVTLGMLLGVLGHAKDVNATAVVLRIQNAEKVE